MSGVGLEGVRDLFGKSLANVTPINNDVPIFSAALDAWILSAIAGGGEANTSSNVGTGEGLAKAKVGVDLPFKSLLGTASEIDLVGNVNDVTFSINAAIARLALAQTFTAKQTFTPTATIEGINVGQVAVAPSTPVNGGIWYNSGSNNWEVFQGGIVRQIVLRDLAQILEAKTLITPTIANFVNATHDHSIASQGGDLAPEFVKTNKINTYEAFAQIFRGNQEFRIRNAGNTFSYLFQASGISADRLITLPLLVANGSMIISNFTNTFGAFRQTFQASSTQAAIRLVELGVIPSTLFNGDLWVTTALGLNFRHAGVSKVVALLLQSQTFENKSMDGSLNTFTNLPNSALDNLPVLGTLPASPRQLNIVNSEIDAGAAILQSKLAAIALGDLPNLPVLGTLPASPRQTAIVNAEISTVDTSKVTTGRFVLARLPTGTNDQFFRGTGAGSPAYEAIEISKGGTVLDPDVRNIIVWRAPFPCTVTNVRGYRVGGTTASINARRNGTSTHLASDNVIGTADVWDDGGAVQNTAYVAGDKLEIMITVVTGSPTQVAVQVDFTRP